MGCLKWVMPVSHRTQRPALRRGAIGRPTLIQFVWDNNEIVGSATTDGTGLIAPTEFDLGVRDSGVHILTAIDSSTNSVSNLVIQIPCPPPEDPPTPTATPTLIPPDLVTKNLSW